MSTNKHHPAQTSEDPQKEKSFNLTREDRLRLLERVTISGVSVTQACRAFNVSRTTFYKWKWRMEIAGKSDQEKLQALADKKPRRRRAAKQRIRPQVQEIIRSIVARRPEWGKRRLHRELLKQGVQVGIHGVGNALLRLRLNTPLLRLQYSQAKKAGIPAGALLQPEDRRHLVERVLRGRTPLAVVAQDAGVSRLILYKWMRRYLRAAAEGRDVILALSDRERQVGRLPNQANQEQEHQVLTAVLGNPSWGKYRLAKLLRDQHGFVALGVHGVANVLRRHDLHTRDKRRAWAITQPTVQVRPEVSWEDRLKQVGEEFLPTLAPAPPPRAPFGTWLRRVPPGAWLRSLQRLSISLLLSISILFILFSWGRLLGSASSPSQALGFAFASLALSMGTVFFLYSLKYYFTLAVVLSFSREADSDQRDPFHSERSDLSKKVGPLHADLLKPGSFLGRLFGLSKRTTFGPTSSTSDVKEIPTSDVSISGQAGGLPHFAESDSASVGGLEPDLTRVTLERHPMISVHIPMYNEPKVAERILRACTGFTYEGRYEVIVVDDSTDETTEIVKRFAAEWNAQGGNLEVRPPTRGRTSANPDLLRPRIKVIHRDTREGFKGGALRQALSVSDPRAEFIVVFDADFVPYPDTLELFLKYFQVNAGTLVSSKRKAESAKLQRQAQNLSENTGYQQSNVAAVQGYQWPFDSVYPERSRGAQGKHVYGYQDSNVAAVQGYQWHVLNKSENWITRGVRSEYAGSYVIERSGAELYGGLKQIAGSVYMIRRDLLETFGWGTSLTEDFELTLKLYEVGYRVVYTPYIQAPAECASTLKRLIRQRMRWAEGHSFNIRKMFLRLLLGGWSEGSGKEDQIFHFPSSNFHVLSNRQLSNSQINGQWQMDNGQSPQVSHRTWLPSPLSLSEKLEFLYLSPYYLQAAFFLLGTLSWLISETIFKARLPFWTTVWGWSLVLTNLLSLPLMNLVGLFLEEAEERDYGGILAFILLSYLLTPFQAYASVKGFLEEKEGPWFRTPKTGRITDILTRGRFYRFIRGFLPGRVGAAMASLSSGYRANNITIQQFNHALAGASVQRALSGLPIRRRQRNRVGRGLLAGLLISTILLNYFSFFTPGQALAQAPDPTIEQQINIIDQQFECSSHIAGASPFCEGSTDSKPTDNSLGIIQIDPAKYKCAGSNCGTLYFSAVGKTTGAVGNEFVISSGLSMPSVAKQYTVRIYGDSTTTGCTGGQEKTRAAIQLYNITDASVTTTLTTSYSSCFIPGSQTISVRAARVHIVQSDATNITDTRNYIELGDDQHMASQTYKELIAPKYSFLDKNKYSGTVSAYIEATLQGYNTGGGTLNNLVGFETKGTVEARGTSGSPTIVSSPVRSGSSALQVSAATDIYDVAAFEGGTSNDGNDYLLGIAFRTTALPSSGEPKFIIGQDDANNRVIAIAINSSGKLVLHDSAGSTVDTGDTTISTGQWYYLEMVWKHQNPTPAPGGTADVYLDGSPELSVTGQDFLNIGAAFTYYRLNGTGSGSVYFDDLYAASGGSGTSDLLGSAEVFGYQSGNTTGTSDAGNNLDQNQWDDTGDTAGVDESDANSAGYTNSAAMSGDVYFNDTNARGLGPGPSGDANVDGDTNIRGAKWIHRLDRGAGSTTTHTKRWGNNVDTIQSATVTLGTDPANFFQISVDKTLDVPLSTEYFAMGFQKSSGGRAIYAKEMWAMILHVPGTLLAQAKLQTATSESGPWSDVTGATLTTTSGDANSWVLKTSGDIWSNLTDDQIYRIVVSSSSGNQKIANAKLVIEQTDSSGLTAFETVHQYVNTKSSLSQTGTTAYARMAAGVSPINESKVSTTSSSYVRKRSVTAFTPTTNDYDTEYSLDDTNYTDNDTTNRYTSTNWQGGNFAYSFEATLRTPSANNLDISTSWLIITVTNLQIPESILLFLPLALFLPALVRWWRRWGDGGRADRLVLLTKLPRHADSLGQGGWGPRRLQNWIFLDT